MLAEELRPNLKNIEFLVGPAKGIWNNQCQRWLNDGKFHVVLWGPPGSGKTTLARLLGEASGLPFFSLSAVRDGVKEIRQTLEKSPGCVLFIDEIHRLTRAQQDTLLPILEFSEGWIVGATTESPQVVLSAPLLSRLRTVYVKKPSAKDLEEALKRALDVLVQKNENDFAPERKTHLKEEVIPKIVRMGAGDIRLALNLLESLVGCTTPEEEEDVYVNSLKAYTNKTHYDFASSMIKSMRGSDPDAALFYAFAALDGGEDPLFLFRRCVIFASEDVGNADPHAISLATSCYQAFTQVGMPEGRIPLAQCVTYLASTVKSNRAYKAIDVVRSWRAEVLDNGLSLEPPAEITLKGQNKYKYPHNFKDHFVDFDYLPKDVSGIKKRSGKKAYEPSDQGSEMRIRERLKSLWGKG